jgi:hypothetical protein
LSSNDRFLLEISHESIPKDQDIELEEMEEEDDYEDVLNMSPSLLNKFVLDSNRHSVDAGVIAQQKFNERYFINDLFKIEFL